MQLRCALKVQRERLASKIGWRLSSCVNLPSCRDSSASSVYEHAVLLLLCSEHGRACAWRWWTAYVRASSPSHVLQPRSARAQPGQARPGQASAPPRPEAPGLAQVADSGGVSLPAAAYLGCSSVQPGPLATGWQLLHPAASARAEAPPAPSINQGMNYVQTH